MRTRTSNPFREAHDKPMRCHDFVAPAGTKPGDIPGLIEAAVPGLKLFHRGDNEVNGFVNTSLRADGSLYVSVQLYDTACTDPACPGGHGPVNVRVAPTLTVPQRLAMVAAVGEHPVHRLTGTPADDIVLLALGFDPEDAPRRG